MDCGNFDKKITFQKLDADTDNWSEYYTCHAQVNVAGGNEYLAGGADQSKSSVVFTVRYCKKLKDLYLHTQIYRIIFVDGVYDIQNSEDYMFSHETIRVLAVGKPL